MALELYNIPAKQVSMLTFNHHSQSDTYIIFFLGVVGGFGFLVFRNRQLYEKYTQLANRDVPMEEDVQSGGVRLETE